MHRAKEKGAALAALVLIALPFRSPLHADPPIQLDHGCSYFGEALPTATTTDPAEEDVERLVHRIVEASGLAQNFEIRSALVPNAAAVTLNAKRYILYSRSFLANNASRGGGSWGAQSVLAHEIGHHLNGHTLNADGSRPHLELEADYFSGFILQRLGAPLVEATATMERLAPAVGSPTHPGKVERLKAISDGWMAACRKDSECLGVQAGEAGGPAGSPADDEGDEPPNPTRPPSAASQHY